jgi:hypothetical protein
MWKFFSKSRGGQGSGTIEKTSKYFLRDSRTPFSPSKKEELPISNF